MAKSIIVIGGGTGGYVAAIRAAQLGAQVTLFEKDKLGGTCLNRGCIPTKALLQSADMLAKIKEASVFGISAENVSLDFSVVAKRKDAIVGQLVSGVNFLMKKNKIKVINGVATIIDPKTVGVLGTNEKVKADNIIIASGSKPSRVPIKGIDEPGVITSDDALAMEQLPKSIVIIGGGVIGLEFAQIMKRMGTEVTIVEMMPQVLPAEDTELANMLGGVLEKEGIKVFTKAAVTSIVSAGQKGNLVSFTAEDGTKQEVIAEKVLVSVGRSPATDDLGVDKLGLAMEKARIVVNERMETNITGVYAAGDVIGGFMLAHVAMDEGKCAVENIMGANVKMDYLAVPRCVYTSPELAGVGLTEAEAKEQYGDIKVGKFPFQANGKAKILNETAGVVKIIADSHYKQILGMQILGPHATDLIAEGVLGIKMEATLEEITATIHAHPTLSEAVLEAALSAEGKTLHM